MLELPARKPDAPPVTARGLVKWVQRSVDNGGPHQTAIEFEDPGNIWGIPEPPTDWVEYFGPRDPAASAAKPKPFAIRKPELPAPVAPETRMIPAVPASSTDRPLGQLMGDFQRQMEKTLFDAANTVVRERTDSAIEEVRTSMRGEAKRLLAEAAAAQAGTWMSDFVKQMKQASHDSARALHTEWTKKISADLNAAAERVEERKRDLDQHTQSLSTVAIERVQRGLETSQKEAVNRIVGRLKEQVAPVVDEAKKVTADLSRDREELEHIIDQALDKSSARMEEICARFENQFEMILQSRLDTAREEMERASQEATNLALNNLQVIALHNESEARARFQAALEPVAANALIDLKERATETSRQFSDELADYGRSYLEFVGSSVTDLAKGLGKRNKE